STTNNCTIFGSSLCFILSQSPRHCGRCFGQVTVGSVIDGTLSQIIKLSVHCSPDGVSIVFDAIAREASTTTDTTSSQHADCQDAGQRQGKNAFEFHWTLFTSFRR